jgi:nicotinate-nucleotide adenylyltransferase
MVGVFGGTFDPPHNGHVALLEAAERELAFDRVLVLVVADPGHRDVHASAEDRLALARLAFPAHEVELDEHARTIDMLRERQLDDPVLLVGADELAAFPTWKDPEAVLELARLAVVNRPGYESFGDDPPGRVLSLTMEPSPVSATEVRRRVAAGEPIDDLVPPAVAVEIARLGLYRTH